MIPDLAPPSPPPGESTTTNSVFPSFPTPPPEVPSPFAELEKRVEDLESALAVHSETVRRLLEATTELASRTLSKDAASKLRGDLFTHGR